MSSFNEAKYETLLNADSLGEITSSDLISIFNITINTASMRLKRAHYQGLLSRYRNGREFVYEITEKGIERLEWLDEEFGDEEVYSNDEEVEDEEIYEYYEKRRCKVIRERGTNKIVQIIVDEGQFNGYEGLEDCFIVKKLKSSSSRIFFRDQRSE